MGWVVDPTRTGQKLGADEVELLFDREHLGLIANVSVRSVDMVAICNLEGLILTPLKEVDGSR